jgi:hypothetical protein
MPGGSSLALFLHQKRGATPRLGRNLTFDQILDWADRHHGRTRKWPHARSGPIAEAPGETWSAIFAAVAMGSRGMPGSTTVPRLLQERRGTRNIANRPRLTISQILAWADAWKARTGEWPLHTSGPIRESNFDNWSTVEQALRHGYRGLPGGTTLARLLAQKRGKRIYHAKGAAI